MKAFSIAQSHIDQALIKVEQIKKEAGSQHKAESITKGTSYLGAFIGEIIMCEALGAENISTSKGTSKFNFDIYYKKWKFDAKLKFRTKAPLGEDEASVAKSSLHQKCHGYFFLNIHSPEYRKAFDRQNPLHYEGAILTFCGFQGKKKYLENAEFHWKGKPFKNIKPNGEPFKCLTDMYNRFYNELGTYEELLEIPERTIK